MSKFTHRRHILFMFGSGAAAPFLASSVVAGPLNHPNTLWVSREPDTRICDARLAVKRLEAQFYHEAAYGPLPRAGPAEQVVRRVAFSDPILGRHVREVAADKVEHLALLALARRGAELVVDKAPRPFNRIARAAGLVAPSATFDPYADEQSFLVAALMLESAAAPLNAYVDGRDDVDVAALERVRADAGYHAGLIRSAIQTRAKANAALGDAACRISAVFARFDDNEGSSAAGAHVSVGALLGKSLEGREEVFPSARLSGGRLAGS